MPQSTAIGLTGEPVPPDPQRRGGEEELPSGPPPAAREEVLEPQVVEEVDAHRVEGEHVDGEGDLLGRARGGVAVAVGPERGDLPLGE